MRKVGTALMLAGVMAVAMTAGSAKLQAAGNSQAAICRNLARAIASLTALYGPENELVVALSAEYAANCQ